MYEVEFVAGGLVSCATVGRRIENKGKISIYLDSQESSR